MDKLAYKRIGVAQERIEQVEPRQTNRVAKRTINMANKKREVTQERIEQALEMNQKQ